jgi:hypothetical protein
MSPVRLVPTVAVTVHLIVGVIRSVPSGSAEVTTRAVWSGIDRSGRSVSHYRYRSSLVQAAYSEVLTADWSTVWIEKTSHFWMFELKKSKKKHPPSPYKYPDGLNSFHIHSRSFALFCPLFSTLCNVGQLKSELVNVVWHFQHPDFTSSNSRWVHRCLSAPSPIQ